MKYKLEAFLEARALHRKLKRRRREGPSSPKVAARVGELAKLVLSRPPPTRSLEPKAPQPPQPARKGEVDV